MIRDHVMSTDLHSVGYHAESGTLEIEFTSGGVYQYLNVPHSTYSALMRASSKGTYFHEHIKNSYPARRV